MAISKPARSAGCDLAAERPRHWPRSGLVTLAAEHSANLITKHAAVRLKKPKIFFGRAPRARSAQPLRGSGAPRKAAPRPILALRLTRSASRRLTDPPPEPAGVDPFNILVAAAFTSLDFVERGC